MTDESKTVAALCISLGVSLAVFAALMLSRLL